MNNIPIFLTESLESFHLPSFEVEAIPVHFLANVNLKNDSFHIPESIPLNEYARSNRIIIFGHDLDEYGQLISSILYYELLRMGVDDSLMIRMPLTDKVIGIVTTFYSKKELSALKDYHTLERIFLNANKNIGLRKALMLKHLHECSLNPLYRVKNISPTKTNTITYITKSLLGESHA